VFKIFDWVMTKLKRKLILVNYEFDVIYIRYCILWSLLDKDGKIKKRMSYFPNIYVHNFIDDEWVKKETAHSHFANTLSFILKGSYTEDHNGVLKYRKRFSFNRIKYTEKHAIKSLEKNTWTLFFIGFKKIDDFIVNTSDIKKINRDKADKKLPPALAFHYSEDTLKYIERKKILMRRLMKNVQIP
jgi:hypothetical protein